jgi:hypothetical protein
MQGWPFWARRILWGLALAPIALGCIGAIYQAVATEIDQRQYPPPGELVDLGGYKLHLYCIGDSGPTVILDALFPGTVSNWVWVQPAIAKTTQAALSTNSLTRVIDGATHTGLVDNQTYALQTSAAILEMVEAARTQRPLVSKHP